MLKKNMACIFIVLMLFMNSCATMKRGNTQVISINSVPQGASVRIGREYEYAGERITPAMVILNRKSSYVVTIEKDGFKPENIIVESSASKILWRNLIWIHPLGWLIGVLVDIDSGAGKHLNPRDINIELTPLE